MPVPNIIERDISIGYSGISVHSPEELQKMQVGYSIDTDGNSLVGIEEGDWLDGWYVIGRDQSCGDPIFIDLSDEGYPVYTAMHGLGYWADNLISDTLEGFYAALDELEALSINRETPVALEKNPFSQEDIEQYINKVKNVIGSAELDYWLMYVDTDG